MNLECRFCYAPLVRSFVDLGKTPLANSYLTQAQLSQEEQVYPLHARICAACLLVQVEEVVPPEAIFDQYAYFSSYSDSWLKHARAFAELAIFRLGLSNTSNVIEIASNDGYLLHNFVERDIPCLGIEPAQNVAEKAINTGIPTEIAFFGTATARALLNRGQSADLIVANNVLAHVPDVNDFVAGMKMLLKVKGVITVECPHLLQLIEKKQFDTIYHEHFSYFSFYTLERLFQVHGLRIFDVEQLSTHGGSLRLWICHAESPYASITGTLERMRSAEQEAQLDRLEGYSGFAEKVQHICWSLAHYLDQALASGKTIAAYGAAAKGNTLLNVCNIKADTITFVVDKNPAKQGHYLPGSHIPIFTPEKLFEAKPDIVLILPWNIADEIKEQTQDIRRWGGKWVTAIPKLEVHS